VLRVAFTLSLRAQTRGWSGRVLNVLCTWWLLILYAFLYLLKLLRKLFVWIVTCTWRYDLVQELAWTRVPHVAWESGLANGGCLCWAASRPFERRFQSLLRCHDLWNLINRSLNWP
jgi:hypothetical protein